MKIKNFVTETLTILGLLLLVNFVFLRQDLGFLKVSPHPYWFPILMMGAYYGVRAAFISSMLFSAVYIVFSYTQNYLAIETFFSYRVLHQPILFVIAGTVLGQISQTVKDNLEEAKRKYNVTKSEKDRIQKELEASEKVKQELERNLVSQLTTISTVYDFAKKLETFDIETLYQNTLRTLIDHLNILQATFYKAEHNLLKRVATEYKERLLMEPLKETNKSKGIFNIAISQRKTISLRELFTKLDFETMKTSPMLCAPLFRKNGSLIGVITVDRIHFYHFTPTTVKLFGIVVEWLASAIDNALYLEETKNKNISDEILGLYHHTYFAKRMKEEFDRSKRYALPLSVILFHIQDFFSIRRKSKIPLLQSIAAIFRKTLRDIDIICLYRWEDTWVIILPTLPLKEAEKTRDAIQERITEFAFEPYKDNQPLKSKMAISSYIPKMTSAEELIKKAEVKLDRQEIKQPQTAAQDINK